MYKIIPHKAIGELNLEVPIASIEQIIGKSELKRSKFFDDVQIANYNGGITIEYNAGLSAFIGVLIECNPILEAFEFIDKTFDEIVAFFKTYPGDIFSDGAVIISDFLDISVYTEDSYSKEVGIFSNVHKSIIIEGLDCL